MKFFFSIFTFCLFLFGSNFVAAQTPVGQDGTWDLIFSDEFNGNSVDLNKWEPSWFGGSGYSNPINTDEDGCYHPSQISFDSGSMVLSAQAHNNSNCRLRNGSQAKYVSGMVNSRNSFLFTYGYVEARIYLDGSDGIPHNWPAFWTNGLGPWPLTGEIDVMEVLSGRQPCWHYHFEDSNGQHQGPGGCVKWSNPTGWHTFAAHWEPGKITYYYDGQEVGSINNNVVESPHYIILNYGINDRYGINVPSQMRVDYVRAWKLVDKGEGGTTPPPQEPSSYQINSSSDDAEEGESGKMDLSSSDLELVDESYNGSQKVGLRFNNVDIPQGALIRSASIQFTVDEVNSNPATSLKIYGQDTGQAPTFSTNNNDISSRKKTKASVSWSPEGWNNEDEAASAQRTADLTAVVQEIITRSDWEVGNSLAFIFEGSGARVAHSYDGSVASAPILIVDFDDSEELPPPSPSVPKEPSKPTVTLVSPTDGTRIGRWRRFTFKAVAQSDKSMSEVRFYVNDREVCSDRSVNYMGEYTCSARVRGRRGTATVRAEAEDASGNIGVSKSVDVSL